MLELIDSFVIENIAGEHAAFLSMLNTAFGIFETVIGIGPFVSLQPNDESNEMSVTEKFLVLLLRFWKA